MLHCSEERVIIYFEAIRWCCTHRPDVKCPWVQACLYKAANLSCTSGCPSFNCCNKVPTRSTPPGGRPQALNAPRLTTIVSRNIVEATNATLILLHSTPQVVFHPDAPEFSTNVHTDRAGWPTLPARARAAHAAHALTKTATSDTAIPAAIRSGKINSSSRMWPASSGMIDDLAGEFLGNLIRYESPSLPK